MNSLTFTVYIGPGDTDTPDDDAIVLLPSDLEGTPEATAVLEEISMADVDWFGWITLADDVPCPHENWFKDEDREGRQIRVCEDCNEQIYESEVERAEP